MAMGSNSGSHGGANSGSGDAHGGGNRGSNNGRGRGGRRKLQTGPLAPVPDATVPWQSPQYIPGVKHTVEGANIPDYQPDKTFEAYTHQRERYKNAIEGYNRKQKLRLSIPSLPDSEAVNLEGQKDAVRRRMRGRVGTMLSQREKLG